MNDLFIERTAPVIAAEINTIKHQSEKILLAGAMEIGRRLKEVKDLLPHGEWGKWLEESVSYWQKTAEKLIRVFDAYGTGQLVSLDTGAQAQALPNLNYTQAYILLGVPEEERAQFIAEMDIESMSTRELQKAVADRSQAVKERDLAIQGKADLQQALDNQVSKITQLTTERDNLKTQTEALRKSQAEIEAKAGNLETQLVAIKQNTAYENIQRMTKSLNAAYIKASANKIAFLYENLDKTFKELVWALGEIAANDPDTHAAYKNMVNDFLMKCLKERM